MISEKELQQERTKLDKTVKLIKNYLSEMSQQLYDEEEEIKKFRQFTWKNKNEFDAAEMKTILTNDEIEATLIVNKGLYFKKLFKIQDSPYFASIIFETNEKEKYNVYIGITYLNDKEHNKLIYDWRSPICSLFYDYEVGEANYIAPEGKMSGYLHRKRQYKIEKAKLIHLFDNSINIDDELLQEVLATESSEKMKNIVNTIQKEQNSVIRNIEDKNLIVEGIAGSGKTSVALHRIAFLLYKIDNLTSNNVLIFSPNQIFSEYISNVLPELGEENTVQTTFHDYLNTIITEYKNVESFIDFIEKYYIYQEKNIELVSYKQSDDIIKDMDNYLKDLIDKTIFIKGIVENDIYEYSQTDLNYMLKERYDKLPLFERINSIAIKLSENNYNGSTKKYKTYRRLLMDSLSIKKDYKKIYGNFFKSPFSKINLTDNRIKDFINKDEISYEDSLLFVYIKGFLEGFTYDSSILEVVVDEAQDYNMLQYMIMKKIFKKASWTILGDVNQTINPYYKYDSLENLFLIFNEGKYITLNKTYRSTSEIIDWTNKILGLKHISAIRKENNKPVIFKKDIADLKKSLLKDIELLQKEYKSIAIITKDNIEANMIYKLVGDLIPISLIDNHSKKFNKELLIIPAYIAKGLEFDSVIIYNDKDNKYKENEKYLLYVACTRAQHQLIIYN